MTPDDRFADDDFGSSWLMSCEYPRALAPPPLHSLYSGSRNRSLTPGLPPLATLRDKDPESGQLANEDSQASAMVRPVRVTSVGKAALMRWSHPAGPCRCPWDIVSGQLPALSPRPSGLQNIVCLTRNIHGACSLR